eukprot:s387_g2.t1
MRHLFLLVGRANRAQSFASLGEHLWSWTDRRQVYRTEVEDYGSMGGQEAAKAPEPCAKNASQPRIRISLCKVSDGTRSATARETPSRVLADPTRGKDSMGTYGNHVERNNEPTGLQIYVR